MKVFNLYWFHGRSWILISWQIETFEGFYFESDFTKRVWKLSFVGFYIVDFTCYSNTWEISVLKLSGAKNQFVFCQLPSYDNQINQLDIQWKIVNNFTILIITNANKKLLAKENTFSSKLASLWFDWLDLYSHS